MSPVAIPSWTPEGVLPPVNPAAPTAADRSPYVVSLMDYVLRFGDTPERREILKGFLGYRAALHQAGIARGFQWLDGSFLEQVEITEGRAPNDLDVVTFYRLPAGLSQQDLATALGTTLNHGVVKARHKVDGYLVHLGMEPERLAAQSAYWYGLWSHRRNQRWKGFVQVDLAPADDPVAMAALVSVTPTAGTP